jgi:hypothetical protein
MSMHLIKGVQVHGRTKQKPINASEFEAEFREYNKEARRNNVPQMQFKTLEDYVAYRSGTGKKSKDKPFVHISAKTLSNNKLDKIIVYNSNKMNYNSSDSTTKKDTQHYSGNYMIGIATMHKSNLVPVTRDGDPKEYSTMRRS